VARGVRLLFAEHGYELAHGLLTPGKGLENPYPHRVRQGL
jgi:hypothetical protein